MKKIVHLLILAVMVALPALAQDLPEQAVEVYATVDQAVGNIAFTASI